MLSYGIVFLVAAAVTYVLTPAAWRLATRWGAIAQPDERRVHTRPTPMLGGVAMLAAFLAALGVAALLPQFRAVFQSSSEPLGVGVAAILILAVGMLDDMREVSAPAKVAGQVLAGSVLAMAGVTIFFFRVPFADFVVLSPDLAFLVTVLWVVGMANAVNLIDGLDGLAAGIVAIAAGGLFVYATRLSDVGLLEPENMAPLLVAITCGLCVGFLPHNFHPAKVFMGDGGSMLLGLLMAAATISVGGRTADQFSGQTYFFFAPLVIPFFILGVPIVDTLFAIVRRAVKRASLSQADKQHLHHRLMRLGHGPRRSVLILWVWTAMLSGIVLVPTYTNKGNAVVPFLVGALGVLLYTFFHPGIRQPLPVIEVFDQEAPAPATLAPRTNGRGGPQENSRHLRPRRPVP
ncbi:MAG: undecaprenyl/decaprenyl-phosphate alpha-N-acetylglucosaminyl 1-phosphate transferase [Actinomycetota bacterium]|nr:undecaprenyl/decaprenyl-phosphate alpha-N-acetylglucosaminyl 1-phosphate transferase [Actinomycetota bacterium]